MTGIRTVTMLVAKRDEIEAEPGSSETALGDTVRVGTKLPVGLVAIPRSIS
jgi:hypothetical protein